MARGLEEAIQQREWEGRGMRERFNPDYADTGLAYVGDDIYIVGWLVIDGKVPCTRCGRESEGPGLVAANGKISCPDCPPPDCMICTQ